LFFRKQLVIGYKNSCKILYRKLYDSSHIIWNHRKFIQKNVWLCFGKTPASFSKKLAGVSKKLAGVNLSWIGLSVSVVITRTDLQYFSYS